MKNFNWKVWAWEWVADCLAMIEEFFTYLATVFAELCYKAHLKAFEQQKDLDRGQNNGSRW